MRRTREALVGPHRRTRTPPGRPARPPGGRAGLNEPHHRSPTNGQSSRAAACPPSGIELERSRVTMTQARGHRRGRGHHPAGPQGDPGDGGLRRGRGDRSGRRGGGAGPRTTSPTWPSSTSRCRASDGLAAARAIRPRHKVAVLILTAFSQRDLIDEARDAGVAAYLVKPFQRSELMPAIDQAMARCEQEWAIDAEAQQADADGGPDRSATAEDKIETRRLVDGAKGVLMERHGHGRDRGVRLHPADGHADPGPHARRGPAGRSTARSRPRPGDPHRHDHRRRPANADTGHRCSSSTACRWPSGPTSPCPPIWPPPRRGHQRRARVRLHAGRTWSGSTSPVGAGGGLRPARGHLPRRDRRGLQGGPGRDPRRPARRSST